MGENFAVRPPNFLHYRNKMKVLLLLNVLFLLLGLSVAGKTFLVETADSASVDGVPADDDPLCHGFGRDARRTDKRRVRPTIDPRCFEELRRSDKRRFWSMAEFWG